MHYSMCTRLARNGIWNCVCFWLFLYKQMAVHFPPFFPPLVSVVHFDFPPFFPPSISRGTSSFKTIVGHVWTAQKPAVTLSHTQMVVVWKKRLEQAAYYTLVQELLPAGDMFVCELWICLFPSDQRAIHTQEVTQMRDNYCPSVSPYGTYGIDHYMVRSK